MALTFREQIEATAWELGNGEGTTPELRKRFEADPETPNFDPTKALELLHILQLINYKQVGKGRRRARCHYLKKPEYGLLNLNEPKPAPKDERERETRIQWAKDFRVIADWLDANCYTTESEEAKDSQPCTDAIPACSPTSRCGNPYWTPLADGPCVS